MNRQPFTLFFSSAGRRVALLEIFRQTLADLQTEGLLLAADMTKLAPACHAADQSFVVPHCTAPDFLPEILNLCETRQVKLLIPTIDTELPIYAEAKERFAQIGTAVAISSPSAVQICGNKQSTHRWLTEAGFPTVRQIHTAEADADWRELQFPVIVKPTSGSASIGVKKVSHPHELELCFAEGDQIIQSIAPGREYTVDTFVDDEGTCRCAVPRRRLEVRAGEVSKAITVRSVQLERLACRISEALPGARGPLNVQIFWDEASDELNVIEINPRFGGGYPLAWAAGAHFPRWMIQQVLGLPTDMEACAWRNQVTMLRYDQAIFVEEDLSRGVDIPSGARRA